MTKQIYGLELVSTQYDKKGELIKYPGYLFTNFNDMYFAEAYAWRKQNGRQ